jgi:predicted ATPase/DNA-binding winged helix-turn-helix (wHTH) protein
MGGFVAANTDGAISFGPFRLFPSRRLLERDGAALSIGDRALDILVVLAAQAGEVVSKRDLVNHVWADINVDEGSLRYHISALRRALGDGRDGARYIATVAGRGYSLVAPVVRPSTLEAPPNSPIKIKMAERHSPALPAQLGRMIGRDDIVRKIGEELNDGRFVSVVGPGGIGKTTVAIAVAHLLSSSFDDEVYFFDLSSIGDPNLVAGAVASALSLPVSSDDPVPGLLALLKDRRVLLLFDCCEHVINEISALSEAIFEEAPHVYILATSRESLRVEGERVHRIFPLACPPQGASLNLSQVLAFPAAQLFIERANANASHVQLSEADSARITDICNRLDGIALAIELAASQVGTFGIEGILSLLNKRFAVPGRGRRTAAPRHQTLAAALDWSYDLLSERERTVLSGLAVFVGPFSLEAAQAVLANDEFDETEVVDCIDDLVAKSLVASDIGTMPARYRLLDTTRSYLLAKPADRIRFEALARRHAIYYCEYLRDLETQPGNGVNGYASARQFLGNVRSALEWSFIPQEDQEIAIALAASAAQLFLDMSLLTECLRWSERAIATLTQSSIGTRCELVLQTAYAISAMFTRGNRDEVRRAFLRGLELAERIQDAAYQLQLLSNLHIFLTRIGDQRGALEIGKRSEALAKAMDDRPSIVMAEWMIGVAEHLIGSQAPAIKHCESAMTPGPVPRWAEARHLGYDRRIIALVSLTRSLWLGGFPDRAVKVASYTVSEAEKLGHPLTICIAIIWTTYTYIWTGNWVTAEQAVGELMDYAEKHFLGPYQAVGRGLQGKLLLQRGDRGAGLRLVRECLAALHSSHHNVLTTVFASDLAEGLTDDGRPREAINVIDEAIVQIGPEGENFDAPETYRIKGRIFSALGRFNDAETCFLQSLELAKRQSALGWELRTAVALARLWSSSGRARDATSLLGPIYANFTEGFGTSDLIAAKRLLEQLSVGAA